jgi:hypothetical protein
VALFRTTHGFTREHTTTSKTGWITAGDKLKYQIGPSGLLNLGIPITYLKHFNRQSGVFSLRVPCEAFTQIDHWMGRA